MSLPKVVTVAGVVLSIVACNRSIPIQPSHIIEGPHAGGSAVALADHASLGVSGGWAGAVKIWSLHDGRQKAAWQAHDGEVTGLHFIEQDRAIISSGYDGRIAKWDLDGKRLMQVETASAVTALAASSRAGVLVTGHKDGSVMRWDMGRLAPLAHDRIHKDRVRAVAFNDASRLVASSDADGAVYLWHEGAQAARLDSLQTDVRALGFSHDGRYLYGGTWFDLYRWDLSSKTAEKLHTEHWGIINDLKLSPDGSELLTISRQTDSAVLSLDPVTGKTLRNFGRHELCGTAVDVSRDGNYLLSTSDDGSVRIWSLNATPEMLQ